MNSITRSVGLIACLVLSTSSNIFFFNLGFKFWFSFMACSCLLLSAGRYAASPCEVAQGAKIKKLILFKTQGKAVWIILIWAAKRSLGPSKKVKNLNVPLVYVNTWTWLRFFWYKISTKGEPNLWKIQTHFSCFNAHLLIICICIFTNFCILLIWSLKGSQWK